MGKESILIVDDDIQVLSSYKRGLEEDNYNITTVKSGEEALKLLKEQKYNLILLDIVMEGINGFQVLEEVKKLSPETVVILISGYVTIETTIEALRKDAIDYIVKPCDKRELKFRVKKALERQQLGIKDRESEIYQKMSETLGAVAHELNSPLTALIGNVDMLTMDLPIEHPMFEQLLDITISTEKMAVIINKMKEIRGIETKQYTKDSKIIDIQKSAEFKKPEEKTVLVVDDEKVITSMVSNFLTKNGYDVDTAESGIKALKMIKNKNYSIVILDICISQMDGYETLQKMNQFYTEKQIQIPSTIMITGYDVEDILQKCKEIGAYTALHKPFKLSVLLETVKHAEKFMRKYHSR